MVDYEREPARRVFAGEFEEATHDFKESDDERAPNYVLLPTGEKANRVFVVGTITEVEQVSEDSEFWRARVVDPTGVFYVTAGQYDQKALSVLREVEPPEYLAIVGKTRTFNPEDSDDTYMSVNADDISVVDEVTRDYWVAETAEQALDRIEFAAENPNSEYVQLAAGQYDTTPDDYREMVLEALEDLENDDVESEEVSEKAEE